MPDTFNLISLGIAVVAIVFSGINTFYQRRQTRAAELGQAVEVTIKQDLSRIDGPIKREITRQIKEGVDRLEKMVENGITDARQKMQGDTLAAYNKTLDEETTRYKDTMDRISRVISDEQTIRAIAGQVQQMHGEVLDAKQRVDAEVGRVSGDMASQAQALETLQGDIEDIRNGAFFHDVTRSVLRTLAEQLLKATDS